MSLDTLMFLSVVSIQLLVKILVLLLCIDFWLPQEVSFQC